MNKLVLKNIFIICFSVLGFGFLSAQFIIPWGINNTLQIIESVWVTDSGTSTGNTIMYSNTGANNIYINPTYLPIVVPYSGSYVLTLNNSGYLSLTSMTAFIENNNFSTNGLWNFGGDTVFNDSVTFSTGPVIFNNVTTTFSGGTVNNTNVSTNNNGGTTNNTNNTVNNSGSVINNTGVTNNNYAGTITNYYTGSTIVYQSGTTIIFATGVVVTGAAIMGPQGPQWPQGIQWLTGPQGVTGAQGPQGITGADGVGSPQMLSFNDTTNELSITSWNSVPLPFWSLVGNVIDDSVHFLGTLTQETLRIVTNNIERMTILRENGYVGINNPNPEKMLHVNGAIASSLMKVSTWGTSIDLSEFGHYQRFESWAYDWNAFVAAGRSGYYTPDGKAFFFPLPQGTNYFGDGGFLSGLVQYIVFIDVQDVNTVILEPGAGEAFYVGGFINGTAWQKLSVIQRDFAFDASGNAQNVSLAFPSPFFEEVDSGGDIITGIPTNTLDYLFSSITQSQRGSAVSDSYKHFPSHPGIFNGWFNSTYNWSGGAGDAFAFQVLDILGFCNLPRVYDENLDDGPGVVCVRWTTYVYDGEYWLRTYGWL